MTRIALVSQGGIQLQSAGRLAAVDIDRIFVCVVQRRSQVKCGRGVGFQAFRHGLYGGGDGASGNGGKASGHTGLQIQKHLRYILVGKLGGRSAGVIFQQVGIFRNQLLNFFVLTCKAFGQKLLDIGNGAVRAGFGYEQLLIICPALRRCAQSAELDGGIL